MTITPHPHHLAQVTLQGVKYDVTVEYFNDKGESIPLDCDHGCNFEGNTETQKKLQQYINQIITPYVETTELELKDVKVITLTDNGVSFDNNPPKNHIDLKTQKIWKETSKFIIYEDYQPHNGNDIEALASAGKFPLEGSTSIECERPLPNTPTHHIAKFTLKKHEETPSLTSTNPSQSSIVRTDDTEDDSPTSSTFSSTSSLGTPIDNTQNTPNHAPTSSSNPTTIPTSPVIEPPKISFQQFSNTRLNQEPVNAAITNLKSTLTNLTQSSPNTPLSPSNDASWNSETTKCLQKLINNTKKQVIQAVASDENQIQDLVILQCLIKKLKETKENLEASLSKDEDLNVYKNELIEKFKQIAYNTVGALLNKTFEKRDEQPNMSLKTLEDDLGKNARTSEILHRKLLINSIYRASFNSSNELDFRPKDMTIPSSYFDENKDTPMMSTVEVSTITLKPKSSA